MLVEKNHINVAQLTLILFDVKEFVKIFDVGYRIYKSF